MRRLYRALVPYEWRFWLYKARHPRQVGNLRRQVHTSSKGDFSLRRCDELRAIFVHIPKAAGTSVALSLFGELPYHYTAIQHRVIFGRKLFREYFKFAFVRNPWDRLHSAYTYLRAGGWDEHDRAWAEANLAGFPDFDSFVLGWLRPENLSSYMHFRPQLEFICDRRGRVLIDYAGYFETLPEDFAAVAERLGLSAALARTNVTDKLDYRAAYSAAAAARVAEVYGADIDALGYDFDGLRERRTVAAGRLVPG